MLTGYSIPSGSSHTLDGTGASFLTDVRLANGRPGQVTRLQWLSSGSPATSQYVDLRMSWATAQAIGVILMLGLSCGAGVRVVVTARRASDPGYTFDLGGNSTTQDTVARSDGRVRHIVVPTATDPLIGIQWRIYNDLGGATWATAATVLDIGQAVGMSARALRVKPGWQDRLLEMSDLAFTLGSQPHIVARRNRRERVVELTPAQVEEVREEGLNGTDWWRIENAIAQYQPVFTAPNYLDSAGALDAAALHETGLFGIAQDRGAIRHIAAGKRWYERAITFAEAPEA